MFVRCNALHLQNQPFLQRRTGPFVNAVALFDLLLSLLGFSFEVKLLPKQSVFLRIQVRASSPTKGLERGWKQRARLGRDAKNTDCPTMTRFIRLWNSPQGGIFNFRCPFKSLIRIQLKPSNLSWLVYFASLMEDELRRKTDTICITMRSRANFKAGMKVARSSGKASSVFGPSLAKQR